MNEALLDKLVEECAELIHAVSKVKKFGINNWHPKTKYKNSVTLFKEILDISETLNEVKKHIPRPEIKEMANEVYNWYLNSSERLKEEFASEQFDKLVIYHSSLGREIRNRFNLWHYDWDKKIIDGIDLSNEHPDSISMRVIEEVWRKVNNES